MLIHLFFQFTIYTTLSNKKKVFEQLSKFYNGIQNERMRDFIDVKVKCSGALVLFKLERPTN